MSYRNAKQKKNSMERKTYQFTISGFPMCLALVRRHWKCKAISLYHQRSDSSQQIGSLTYRLRVFSFKSFSYALVWGWTQRLRWAGRASLLVNFFAGTSRLCNEGCDLTLGGKIGISFQFAVIWSLPSFSAERRHKFVATSVLDLVTNKKNVFRCVCLQVSVFSFGDNFLIYTFLLADDETKKKTFLASAVCMFVLNCD